MKNFIITSLLAICSFGLDAQRTVINPDKTGIGISVPDATLHVYGTGSNGTGARIAIGDDLTGGGLRTYVGEYSWQTSTNSDILELHGAFGIKFTQGISLGGLTVPMEINSSGNLLIHNLPTDQTQNEYLVVSPSGQIAKRTVSASLQVATEDVANQRFGIRNSTPEFTLDVVHENGSPFANANNNGLNIRHEGSNNENWTLYVTNTGGDLEFYNNGVKEIVFTNDGTINMLSDRKAKHSIEVIEKETIDNFMKLNPQQYVYKNSSRGNTSYGFIAQEVEDVYPSLVLKVEEEDGSETYTMNYISLIPIITNYTQNQEIRIEALEGEIQDLKTINEQLINKMESLEKQLKSIQP